MALQHSDQSQATVTRQRTEVFVPESPQWSQQSQSVTEETGDTENKLIPGKWVIDLSLDSTTLKSS